MQSTVLSPLLWLNMFERQLQALLRIFYKPFTRKNKKICNFLRTRIKDQELKKKDQEFRINRYILKKVKVLVTQLCPTLCDSMDCIACEAPLSWDSSGKNNEVGCHSLFQRFFPTQGSNQGLLHCRQILYRQRHQGSPRYTLLYIKQINNKDRLCNTENSTQYFLITYNGKQSEKE